MANGIIINQNLYNWDGSNVTKLLPRSSSNLVIERNGVVETYVENWNQFAPYNCWAKDVFEVHKPSNFLQHVYEQNDQYFIYGFEYDRDTMPTVADLKNNLMVQNGTMKIFDRDGSEEYTSDTQVINAGVIVDVMDLNGDIAEEFRVVIFYDADCYDGIDYNDYIYVYNTYTNPRKPIDTTTGLIKPWVIRTSDLNLTGAIDINDYNMAYWRDNNRDLELIASAGRCFLPGEVEKIYPAEDNVVVERNGVAEVYLASTDYEPGFGSKGYKSFCNKEYYGATNIPRYYIYGLPLYTDEEEENRATVADLKNSLGCYPSDCTIKVYSDYTEVDDTTELRTGLQVWLIHNDLVCEEFTYILFGDINKDGEIDGDDCTTILQYLNGMITLDSCQLKAADLMQLGQITSQDKTYIQNVVAGMGYIDQMAGKYCSY